MIRLKLRLFGFTGGLVICKTIGSEMIHVMINYLKPDNDFNLNDISVLGLAHIGDAVFELMVRTRLCTQGASTAHRLHNETVSYVSAKAQATFAQMIIPMLNEEELAIYKRGRNAHVNNVPKGATFEEYHAATGLEVLFGYLYLSNQTDRLHELLEVRFENPEEE
jgi:ribonuclease-3 family protein